MKEKLSPSPLFSNKFCCFRPSDWLEIDGALRPVTYKVVTENFQSLGLRRNKNIMTFTIGDWVRLTDNETVAGYYDVGGIWSALRPSSAKTLSNYMLSKYGVLTKIFQVALENPLYANSYRVKAQGVMLLTEILHK